jgi:hypothetical protein
VLPLSVSYRCPRAVVRFAQQFVGDAIQPADNAPEGAIRQIIADDGWHRTQDLRDEDAVLCRYNRPLVDLAYALLRDGTPCRLAGRKDIGAGLKRLARRWQDQSLDRLEVHLQDWLASEQKVAIARDHPERGEAAQDQVETLHVVMDRCREQYRNAVVDDAVVEIDRMFGKADKSGVLLSTIHKAKGLEWPRVYWLRMAASRRQRQAWQEQQETNLNYVAATRAQAELILAQEPDA